MAKSQIKEKVAAEKYFIRHGDVNVQVPKYFHKKYHADTINREKTILKIDELKKYIEILKSKNKTKDEIEAFNDANNKIVQEKIKLARLNESCGKQEKKLQTYVSYSKNYRPTRHNAELKHGKIHKINGMPASDNYKLMAIGAVALAAAVFLFPIAPILTVIGIGLLGNSARKTLAKNKHLRKTIRAEDKQHALHKLKEKSALVQQQQQQPENNLVNLTITSDENKTKKRQIKELNTANKKESNTANKRVKISR